MELKRLSQHIWYMPFEEERDRPNLGYVKGDNYSIAIDAGHSAAHTRQFYDLLEKENLPLPSMTVITHWHWDHTFGMHAVNGLRIANSITNNHLKEYGKKLEKEGTEEFLSMYDAIRNEYADNLPVIVTLADIVYDLEMTLDLGGCSVKLIQSEAPHTDDSTLVFVPEEKVLFIGDSACGALPDWRKDPRLCRKLADSINMLDADTVIDGHWVKQTKDEALNDLHEN
jgi:glyoxylase-like metal-dependent hydrolase (beta-lactamase superfamily II)